MTPAKGNGALSVVGFVVGTLIVGTFMCWLLVLMVVSLLAEFIPMAAETKTGLTVVGTACIMA